MIYFGTIPKKRLRAQNIYELSLNKHLKDVQQLTFQFCTHLDHVFEMYKNDDKKRFEELAIALYVHLLNEDEKDKEKNNELIKRLGAYTEYQMLNMNELPDEYLYQGSIDWGSVVSFNGVDVENKDNKDDNTKEYEDYLRLYDKNWRKVLTDSGEPYYWNIDSNVTQWEIPKSKEYQ